MARDRGNRGRFACGDQHLYGLFSGQLIASLFVLMASSNVLTITETNFDSEILHSTVPVLVDFWAPWCGPCKMLSPVIDEIADAKVGQVKVAKVNVDDAQALAARYRINSIPALLFFKNGEPVEQLVGAVSKSVLTAKLDSLL